MAERTDPAGADPRRRWAGAGTRAPQARVVRQLRGAGAAEVIAAHESDWRAIVAAVRLPVGHERQELPAALRLLGAIRPPLATAVGISILAVVPCVKVPAALGAIV